MYKSIRHSTRRPLAWRYGFLGVLFDSVKRNAKVLDSSGKESNPVIGARVDIRTFYIPL